jgi:hypothetical protein
VQAEVGETVAVARSPTPEIRINKHNELLPHDRRSQRPLPRRLVNGAGDCACKNLRADPHISRTARVCFDQRLVTLPAFRFEAVVCATRIIATRTLFQQNAVRRRISTVHRDHPVHERFNALAARHPIIRRRA